MDKKYEEFVGVDSIYAAIILEDTADNYTADTPEYLAPAAEITGEAEVENAPQFYDNVPATNYVTEGVTTLTLTISGIPADLAAKYLGKSYDAASGRVYDSGDPKPPDVALAFRFQKGKSNYRYYQYLKGTFSGGSEEAATKTNAVDVRTYQLTFTAVSTTHKWEIDGEEKPLKRIFADTTDEAFNPAGWFSQVQTPDTEIAPAALSIASITPAANATGVSVNADAVVTFSNKIREHNVFLVNSPDGTIVPATLSFDATGKILTINPNSALGSNKRHAIVISSVIDIYGQELANTLNYFTTA